MTHPGVESLSAPGSPGELWGHSETRVKRETAVAPKRGPAGSHRDWLAARAAGISAAAPRYKKTPENQPRRRAGTESGNGTTDWRTSPASGASAVTTSIRLATRPLRPVLTRMPTVLTPSANLWTMTASDTIQPTLVP